MDELSLFLLRFDHLLFLLRLFSHHHTLSNSRCSSRGKHLVCLYIGSFVPRLPPPTPAFWLHNCMKNAGEEPGYEPGYELHYGVCNGVN